MDMPLIDNNNFHLPPLLPEQPPESYSQTIEPQSFLPNDPFSNTDHDQSYDFAQDNFDLLSLLHEQPYHTQIEAQQIGARRTTSANMTSSINTRKRKAPTLRAEDWEPCKARVIELHINQNKTLPEVKAIMEQSGFRAEIRQYKSILTKWGVGKNVKPHEMQAIVRKRQQRRLEEEDKAMLRFRVRGNEVDEHKIERWMKEKRIPASVLYAPSLAAETPSVISCSTLSDRGTPTPRPHLSARSPILLMSPPSAFRTSSPALSTVSSILRSSELTFTGLSPALSHRKPILASYPSRSANSSTRSTSSESTYSAFVVNAVVSGYRQADEQRWKEELSGLEFVHGVDHPTTFEVLRALGAVFCAQGRFNSAERIFRKLIEASRKEYEDDHLITLSAMGHLSEVFMSQGKYSSAETILRQCLVVLTTSYGQEDGAILHLRSFLAQVYLNQSRFDDAERLLVQNVEAKRISFGPEHPSTLTCLYFLAETYRLQGRLLEAEKLARRTLDGNIRIYGRGNHLVSRDILLAGRILLAQQRAGEAGALILEALGMAHKSFGPEHPNTLFAMHELSSCWNLQGQQVEAVNMLSNCVRLKEKVFGANHPETKLSASVLAKMLLERVISLWAS